MAAQFHDQPSLDLVDDGQRTAPVCVEFCAPEPPQAFLSSGLEFTAWMDQAGVWHVARAETV